MTTDVAYNKNISNTLQLRFNPMIIKEAKGCEMIDQNNKKYLDLTAGWAVMNIGYSHSKVAEAIYSQYQTLSFTTQLSAPDNSIIRLAEKLIKLTPGDFEKKVWFGHSGSDANEWISKIIPFHKGKNKIISFIGSYHGQTLGSSSLSGHSAQSKFQVNPDVIKIPYPNPYRPFTGIEEALTEQLLTYMDELFITICPIEEVAGIILEPIQSDGGVIIPPKEFLIALRGICDKHGIPLIFDEVKVGMGRTGKWFACEHFEVIPDVVVLGKALGAGLPLSAVVGRKEILDQDNVFHMFTTGGNPLSAIAALTGIEIIEEENLIHNAQIMGDYFLGELIKLKEKHSIIGEVRGKGLAIGIELVKDQQTRQPDSKSTAIACYNCFLHGLLVYNVGVLGNVLEITPPLTITKEEIDSAISILNQVFIEIKEERYDWTIVQQYAGWS